MKSGDTVEVEIEGIGTLKNRVQAEGQSFQPDG
jgi:2-keto-4-pentenoate hydratase/2-oxohepta-3-ene-1,7-dioic acid hydratase in catechol pathway